MELTWFLWIQKIDSDKIVIKMATLDKLVKTVESLRLYQSPAISMDQNLS